MQCVPCLCTIEPSRHNHGHEDMSQDLTKLQNSAVHDTFHDKMLKLKIDARGFKGFKVPRVCTIKTSQLQQGMTQKK